MVGSHFVRTSALRVHAVGRTNPALSGTRVEEFSPFALDGPSDVEEFVRNRTEPAVINFAGRTDVDLIERFRKSSGLPDESDGAWKVNALAPESMARGAFLSDKYFVHISTDFVFDGTAGPYDESSPKSAFSRLISWYGWSKSLGEGLVQAVNPRAAIVRISYPYRAGFPAKLDFARRLVARQRNGNLPALYTDQLLTPTWIPDVTLSVETLITTRASGIFHVASPDRTTPYEFADRLFHRIGASGVTLTRGSLVETLREPGSTPRPVNGGLRCNRLMSGGLSFTSWQAGIDQLAREEGWS